MKEEYSKYLNEWVLHVKNDFKSWSHYAMCKGVTPAYIHMVKVGKSKITNYLLRDIGIMRLMVFRKIETPKFMVEENDLSRECIATFLRDHIESNYTFYKDYAKEKKISAINLSKMLSNKMIFSNKILEDIGYERAEVYLNKEAAKYVRSTFSSRTA